MRRRNHAWAAVGLVGFVVVMLAVTGGVTASIDQRLLAALRLAKYPSSAAIAAWGAAVDRFTILGSLIVRAPVMIVAALLLAMRGQRRMALALIVGCVGESLAVEAIKTLIQRPRPDLLLQIVSATHTSFPSAHAAGSMLLYPLAGLFLGSMVGRERLGALVGMALAILIGLSRLLLGVHWPSDVLAGWLFGGAVALIGAGALRPAPLRSA